MERTTPLPGTVTAPVVAKARRPQAGPLVVAATVAVAVAVVEAVVPAGLVPASELHPVPAIESVADRMLLARGHPAVRAPAAGRLAVRIPAGRVPAGRVPAGKVRGGSGAAVGQEVAASRP
jgi:hypothetical protein